VKRRAAFSLVAVFAIGVVGAGVASAGATPGPTEYFTATSTSASGDSATVVASGPISATGTDMQLGVHRDNFVFPDGTLTIRHEPLTRSQKFDSRTCTFTYTETGTYDISHGTGSYAHVTGYGKYKVFAVGTGCDPNEPPTSFSQTIQAHGPLTVGA
jgi:hypothetical protein